MATRELDAKDKSTKSSPIYGVKRFTYHKRNEQVRCLRNLWSGVFLFSRALTSGLKYCWLLEEMDPMKAILTTEFNLGLYLLQSI